MSNCIDKQIISLGDSLDGRKRIIWSKLEHDAFEKDPSYAPLINIFESKGIEKEFFILSIDGKNVGRAKIAVDMNWISKKKENVGFIDDFAIISEYKDYSDMLLQKCILILKEKEGVDEVLIRYNLPAMQFDSFDKCAVFPCTHTPSWYLDIFKRNGFEITKKWVAYRATIEGEFKVPEEEIKSGGGIVEDLGWEIRRLNFNDEDELKQFYNLFYEAFIGHFGWNPAGVIEVEEKNKSGMKRLFSNLLMRLLRFEVWCAFDKDKKMMAFAVIHPEYNEVMNATIKGNKLLRLPKLIINLRRAKVCTLDGVALSKDLRGLGFAKNLAPWAINFGMNELGYRGVDAMILTDNLPSIKTAQPLIDRYLRRFGVSLDVQEMNYVTMAYKFNSGDK